MNFPNGELLDAQTHILNQIGGFMNSASLKCAVQLGIADIIHKHGKPMTISELVDALPITKARASFVHRLMRILIHSGFFTKSCQVSENEEEEDSYLLTPTAHLLLKDEPLSMRPLLLVSLDPIMTEPWHHLSQWFQNDLATTFETAQGRSFWDYAGHEPRLNHFFNEAMASDARLVSSVIIKDCKQVFEGINSLVDVGGGTGTMAKAIADAFPHLQCTVFDLPHVVDGLQGINNLSYVGGDMFDYIPPADAVLLKWILHDWNDEESIKILKKCKEAIPSKDKAGKLIIIDMVVDTQKGDDESIKTQLCSDLSMMVLFAGKERNEKDWTKLFSDAGFSDYKITTTLGARTLVEVYP